MKIDALWEEVERRMPLDTKVRGEAAAHMAMKIGFCYALLLAPGTGKRLRAAALATLKELAG